MSPSPNQNAFFAALQQRSRLPDTATTWRWVGRDEAGLAIVRSDNGTIVRARIAGNAAIGDGDVVLYVPPQPGQGLGQVQLATALPVQLATALPVPFIERREDAVLCQPAVLPVGEQFELVEAGLSLLISSVSGSISQVLFGGSDWYRPGAAVSDFAIAINGVFDLGTARDADLSFALSTVSASVSGDGSSIVAQDFQGNIDYKSFPMFREYFLVNSAFVVRTYISNNSGASALIELAETFDPDQDIGQGGTFDTKNSAQQVAGVTVAQSEGVITTYTAIMGSPTNGSVIEAADDEGIFQINDLTLLRQFLNNPEQGTGLENDLGIHCGIRATVPPNACFRFTMVQGLGLTVQAARTAFSNALSQA